MSALVGVSGPLRRAACIDDLRCMAQCNLPRMVFDYIDGASGDEATARRNRSGFDGFLLRPEILVDLSSRSISTTLFGEQLAMPVIVGPTGLNGAYWAHGDLALARAAKAHKIPFVMSTAATVGLSAMAAHAGPLRWFQLYMLNDRGLAKAFLERVAASGFDVLQLTVDTAVSARRNRDIRNGFTLPFRWTTRNIWDTMCHPRWALQMLRTGSPSLALFEEVMGPTPRGSTIAEVMQQQISCSMTWRDILWLREQWGGKLVLKGVSSSQHVLEAKAAGVDGVVVSNHGGRQLDGSASTIEQLPRIVQAVAGQMTVLIDGGFRSGSDIAKALALGADAVQLGRPTLYGLAAAGEAGVSHALKILGEELQCALALSGAKSIADMRGRVVQE